MNGDDRPRPFYWQRHGGWRWDSPDPIYIGGDDTRPGVDFDYTSLPGVSESISSDFFPTDGKKPNFIPILIIGFLLYKYL